MPRGGTRSKKVDVTLGLWGRSIVEPVTVTIVKGKFRATKRIFGMWLTVTEETEVGAIAAIKDVIIGECYESRLARRWPGLFLAPTEAYLKERLRQWNEGVPVPAVSMWRKNDYQNNGRVSSE